MMTTFSFDFHHFESQVMRVLKKKGVSNISVFADSKMLDESIGFSTGNIHAINSAYSINGVHSKGAFHPKLIFCAGHKQLLVLFGSGNLTNGGHGKSHELFSGLYAQDKESPQLPLINEIWYYLRSLTKTTKGISIEKIDWLKANNNLLPDSPQQRHLFHKIDDDIELALLYNEGSSIYKQLLDLISKDEIKEVNIYCPFYDRDGRLLLSFAHVFPESTVSVYLETIHGNPPVDIASQHSINFYLWNNVKRAKSTFKNFERKLHAKIFHFKATDCEYLLIGSPNATIAAFGTEGQRGINEEFAVLYKIKSLDVIQELGLVSKSNKKINPKDLIRITDIEGSDPKKLGVKSIYLVGADRLGRKVTAYTQNPIGYKSFNFRVLDYWGEILQIENFHFSNEKVFQFVIGISIELNQVAYLEISDDAGQIVSNKQLINNADQLSRTNPSKENYLTLQLENKIDSEEWNDLDIINFFNTIKNLEIEENSTLKETVIQTEGEEEKSSTRSISTISYSQAIELMHDPNFVEQLSRQHHTVRIWDSIYYYFNNLEKRIEDSDHDDEEDGDISSGSEKNERVSTLQHIVLSSEKVFSDRQKQYLQIITNYLKALEKSVQIKKRKISLIDVCQYLIIVKTLLRITQRTIEYKTQVKIDNKIKTKSHQQEFLPVYGGYEELNNFTGIVLNTIGKFNLMLYYNGGFESISDEYQCKKFEEYKKLTLAYSIFTLAILRQKHLQSNTLLNAKIWIESLTFDLFQKIKQKVDYRLQFEKILQYSSLRNIDLNEAVTFAYEMTDQFFQNRTNCFYHDQFGYCQIEKRIPDNNPKFVKISKPGFPYDEFDDIFTLDKLVEMQTGRLFESKQHFKKQSQKE